MTKGQETDSLKLPEAFVRRIEGQLGEELSVFLRASGEEPLRGIRFNPLRKAEWLSEDEKSAAYRTEGRWDSESAFSGEDLEDAVPWAEGAWYLKTDSEAGTTVAHEAGAFYIQEPSAMIPAAVMKAEPGEKILDLCAAPGGKSTQMAGSMKGYGLLVCNEPVVKRAKILSRNIERMGFPNTVVTCALPDALAARWPETFDGVMVDAPCSGEGMFRRNPESREEWSEERSVGCAERQEEILDSAAKMVRPGGRLVYSTCTFNPMENEEQVKKFIARHPDFSPEGFDLPGVDGKEGMFTCWPHRMRGEGQFTAKLRRKGDGLSSDTQVLERIFRKGTRTLSARSREETRGRVSAEEIRILEEAGLGLPTPTGKLGNTLIYLEEALDTGGLQVLRMGLHLGEIRERRFLPDHAAALCVFPPDALIKQLTGEEALRYMAGESLEGTEKGWTLMSWNGLILGWGKGSEGRIRNHYPKGLRNDKLRV